MLSVEYEIIQKLCEKDEYGRSMSGVFLVHELFRSDGYVKEIESYYTQKPEVRIYRDFNNLCRVDLVYEFADDQDLAQQWMLLENFFKPENSTPFSKEDMDSYQRGEELILQDHRLTMNIISLFPEGKYSLTSKDLPLFYSLVPTWPNGPALILRFIFQRDDILLEKISDEAVVQIHNEAMISSDTRDEYE